MFGFIEMEVMLRCIKNFVNFGWFDGAWLYSDDVMFDFW